MPDASSTWSSLEIAKLLVGATTPFVVALLGWFISSRITKYQQEQTSQVMALVEQTRHTYWSNQKLIEKRLELYDKMAPLLNKLYCFYMWRGDWKDVSPRDVVQAKRDLDRDLYLYRHLLGKDFEQAYQTFIHQLFSTYTGAGHDARIRSRVVSPNGNRMTDSRYKWDEAWNSLFADDPVETPLIRGAYERIMTIFAGTIMGPNDEGQHFSSNGHTGSVEDGRKAQNSPPSLASGQLRQD
jgi:hypothetical protein